MTAKVDYAPPLIVDIAAVQEVNLEVLQDLVESVELVIAFGIESRNSSRAVFNTSKVDSESAPLPVFGQHFSCGSML